MNFDIISSHAVKTAEGIGLFCRNRAISIREISKRSGITSANLSKCITGKTKLSLPYFVRITVAAGNDEIYDWVFDIPIKRYLVQIVKSSNFLSGTDYVFLILLLKDYMIFQNEHGAEIILNTVFKVLSQLLINNHLENEHGYYENYFDRFYNTFYDSRYRIGFKFSENTISDHQIGMMMHAGGTVIWQDVQNLITWYQIYNNTKINMLKNKNILGRIRNSQEQSYKIDDILSADNEMKMNGVFFSACCLASKNNIILSKICGTDNSSVNIDLIHKIQYGISSFYSCIRTLERDSDRSQSLQDFWTFFRQTATASPYHMVQLQDLLEAMPEYFPGNALQFYAG